MPRDLSRLLRPESLAVFGGGTWAGAVVEACRGMGYGGAVWPVHPARAEVGGCPAVASAEALPGVPDAAFIAVNRKATVEIVAALSALGAGGAVSFASGFAETDTGSGEGAALQSALVEAAGEMPILGPNCYGLINYLDGAILWPDIHGGRRVARGVGVVAQSSNMLLNITMQARGLALGYAVAAGNQAQTSLAEIALALLADDRVTALGLHVEGVDDVPAFEALAAEARARRVPIVALKVGRSEGARAATLSHTASLAGSDAASRAFFARLGIPLAPTLTAFLEMLKLLHSHGALPGRRLVSMSCSGGEASLIADTAHGRRVAFPPFEARARDRIAATLNAFVTVANPLDYHTFIWGDVARMTDTFAAVLATGPDLGLLVLDYPRLDRTPPGAWVSATEAIVAAAGRTGTRTAVVATLPEGMPDLLSDPLLAAGIAPLAGIEDAITAIEAAADIAEAWDRPAPLPLDAPPSTAAEEGGALLDERMAKLSLAAHGLAVPEGRYAANREEAADRAAEIGFPVVLKALGLAHKTEHGALRLGLADAEAVRAAGAAMAAPDGYLVERMVADGVAELLVGVTREAPYGLGLTLGAGGTLTEILADSVTLLIPSTAEEIRAALGRLRMAPLLAGYRGRPQADLRAAVEAALAVQAYALAEADRLLELDINPLIVTPQGAWAADALIRLAPAPSAALRSA
ncbi:MAG: acetate--CoA ligase family protein [Paracoccaceae bacterium]